MLPKTYCWCIDLRVGCIISAIIGILVNGAFFGAYNNHCHTDILGNTHCSDTFKVLVSGSTIGIIGSMCLLFGAIYQYTLPNKMAVALYLIAEPIRIILYLVFAIMSFILLSNPGDITAEVSCSSIFKPGVQHDKQKWCSLLLVAGIIGLQTVSVGIYFWLCAFSFLLKLIKRENM